MTEWNKNTEKTFGLKNKIRSFFTPTPKTLPQERKFFLRRILVWGLKQEFFTSHIVNWLLVLSLTANLINWIILGIFVKPVDFPIILHYNVFFGVDMLGNWKQVFILPLMGIILFIINFLLSLYFYKNKERIASHLLLMAALMLQLSLMIASIGVIIINY